MYTIADIPAFRELILANSSLIHREGMATSLIKGGGQKLEVVIHSLPDLSFIASLVDLNTGKVLLSGDSDANPAVAVFKLFNASTERTARALGDNVEQGKPEDAPNVA